jgi:hypothetical protein
LLVWKESNQYLSKELLACIISVDQINEEENWSYRYFFPVPAALVASGTIESANVITIAWIDMGPGLSGSASFLTIRALNDLGYMRLLTAPIFWSSVSGNNYADTGGDQII